MKALIKSSSAHLQMHLKCIGKMLGLICYWNVFEGFYWLLSFLNPLFGG